MSNKERDDGTIISARLPDQIMKRLRITIGQRKAEKKAPSTQQDIIAEALKEWLDVQEAKPCETNS